MIEKTVFISDTHGFASAWLSLFQGMGLIDENNNWIGGDNVRIVHIGDHVDRGEDSFGLYMWLRQLQEELGADRVIRLIGNHDIQYIGGERFGFERDVIDLIPIMREDALAGTLKFAHHFITESGDEWLCVHAGLDSGWAEHDMPMDYLVAELNAKGQEVVAGEAKHPIITGIGRSRGGIDRLPGITWADFHMDLAPMEQHMVHKQIVGHSIQPNGVSLSRGGMLWGVNVHYDHAQALIYDHATDSFSKTGMIVPEDSPYFRSVS